MLRPEYLFIWILFHLAAVEIPSAISKRGQPDLRATELVANMQYQEAINSYSNIKKVKSAAELRSLAVAFTELGQNDTAIALYERLFKRYPQKMNPTDELNHAILLRRIGNYSGSDSIVSVLKTASFAGYPILNQPGSLFLEETQVLTAKLPKAKIRTFQNNSAHYLPIKDPSNNDWYFHERKSLNTGLLSSVDLSDGLPYAKILKATNWGDSLGVKGELISSQYLNRHFELTHIDSFGNKYVTTNHRLVNDSDAYLLDIFRFYKDPKQGKFTLEPLNDQLWQHNLSGFVMNQSQTKGMYCSDMMGGLGKSDIYMCDIEWNEENHPKLVNAYAMGEVVNTLFSDFDPCFITDDIIAFATEGHVGYGGSDIYFFDVVNNKLVNAGGKINSSGNEYGVRYYDGKLYWSTDAYKSNPQLMEISLSVDLINWFFQNASGQTDLLEPEVEIEEEIPVELVFEENPLSTQDIISNLDVDKGLKFLLLPDSIRLEMVKNLEDSADYNDFKLRTLFYPEDGLICNAKYETEIKIAISLLNQRPDWVVDVSSYTDSRGTHEFNIKLSKERADFLKDYFLFYGVKKDQIDAHGYGEAFPINHCIDGVICSEEEHSRNRRTTLHFKKKSKSNNRK